MGGNSGELILALDTGVAGSGCDLVHISRMPGESRITLSEHAVSRHECLCRSAFFARAAVEYDLAASLAFFFQILFNCKCCRHGTRSKKVVAASVAVSVCDQFFPLL